MANQITLAYSATAAVLGAAALQTAVEGVQLYTSTTVDPVLGQLFGLTVASDTTATVGQVVTRTIVLNMNAQGSVPFAPPLFQVQPVFVDGAAAIFSSSPLDMAATQVTDPPGARTVSITYSDNEGNIGVSEVVLDGQTPVEIPLQSGTNGIVQVLGMVVDDVGALGANAGQLTVSVLNPATPPGEPQPNAQPQSPQDAMQMRLGVALAMSPACFAAFAPSEALQVATLTNFFTRTLALALSTQVTAATPVLS